MTSAPIRDPKPTTSAGRGKAASLFSDYRPAQLAIDVL
jgi:hypothetical protein